MTTLLPRIVTKKELRLLVPYSPQYILRLEKQGRFPRRIQIGPRRVGWRLSDIEAWIAERAAETKSFASMMMR
ncbi:MAG: AlpA family phage regulatory protein [Hyphomicrobium sp.]